MSLTRKVSLGLVLVGHSANRQKVQDVDWTNKEKLEFVKSMVADHFTDKAIYVPDEQRLNMGIGKYPEFYSAGQFISTDGVGDTTGSSVLVVVGHGESMELANKSMMDSVRSVSWDNHAANI